MKTDDLFWPLAVVAALALMGFALWAELRNYEECRATPHSEFYCLTAGGR